MKRRTESQRGYNLIEILVAIAILGVVLLSILSLFLWGRKNVYSGKQMTAAIAIGNRVVEDLAPLTKNDIYKGLFTIADTSTGSTFKFGNPQQEYKNAHIRSTNASIAVTPTQSDLTTESTATGAPQFLKNAWATQLKDAGGKGLLDDGSISIILMPRSGSTTPATFSNASLMQIRVVVSWVENRRRREVILDSVKAQ